jgi:hypothetical protein
MAIILEGADGCGKSTLSAIIAEYFDIEVYHPGRPQTGTEMYDAIYMIKSREGNTVIDRVPWISDVVYNIALNRPHKIPVETMNTFIDSTDIVIWCNPSIDELNIVDGKSHKPVDYLNQVKESSKRIRDEYFALFKSYPYDFFVYDYTKADSITKCLSYIKTRLVNND